MQIDAKAPYASALKELGSEPAAGPRPMITQQCRWSHITKPNVACRDLTDPLLVQMICPELSLIIVSWGGSTKVQHSNNVCSHGWSLPICSSKVIGATGGGGGS